MWGAHASHCEVRSLVCRYRCARPSQISAIFFTHMHNDHTNGFEDLVDAGIADASAVEDVLDVRGEPEARAGGRAAVGIGRRAHQTLTLLEEMAVRQPLEIGVLGDPAPEEPHARQRRPARAPVATLPRPGPRAASRTARCLTMPAFASAASRMG